MDESKLFAEALRDEARKARDELGLICTKYFERIDYLNNKARELENGDASATLDDGSPAPVLLDWAVRLSRLRNEDTQ